MFIDSLIEKIKEKDNHSVIGLDPKIEYVPNCIKEDVFSKKGTNLKSVSEAIYTFNKMIIDEVYDVVPAVKLQLAYYEMYGIGGIEAFIKTRNYAKEKNLIVIADGKRNDIGSTASSYSSAFLGRTNLDDKISTSVFDVDALTVNPYLGSDGVEPFIEDCIKYDKGIFVLVKTSNKSSGQLQDLLTKYENNIYEVVAGLVEEWGQKVIGKNGYSSVGAVVGATYPEQAKVLRKVMKHSYILVPGYGAQGGTSKDVVNSFNDDGLGAIVNASRSVMCAYKKDEYSSLYKEEDFHKASRAEVIRMRDDINSALNNK